MCPTPALGEAGRGGKSFLESSDLFREPRLPDSDAARGIFDGCVTDLTSAMLAVVLVVASRLKLGDPRVRRGEFGINTQRLFDAAAMSVLLLLHHRAAGVVPLVPSRGAAREAVE